MIVALHVCSAYVHFSTSWVAAQHVVVGFCDFSGFNLAGLSNFDRFLLTGYNVPAKS